MNIIQWNVQYYNYLYPRYEETRAKGPDAGQIWSQSKSQSEGVNPQKNLPLKWKVSQGRNKLGVWD